MLNDHPVIRNLIETGSPDGRSGTGYRCPNPNCGAVADVYYSLNGEIIGCEHCIKLRWWYEVEEKEDG